MNILKPLSILLMLVTVSNCRIVDKLKQVGQEPPLSPLTTEKEVKQYTQPIPYPVPKPTTQQYAANSLWRLNANSFFKDQRATQVGDILTVDINITNEAADFTNTTERKREKAEEKANLNNFFNSGKIDNFLKNVRNPAGVVVDFDSQNTYKGTGNIKRTEKLTLKLAAIVTRILPNGNFVIYGKQQIRVNYELRNLMISGIIRPEDISPENSISHDKIAEVRLSYGGEGQLSDVQQPRYGQQIFDILFPF